MFHKQIAVMTGRTTRLSVQPFLHIAVPCRKKTKSVRINVKVDDISLWANRITEVLKYGTLFQGITQF